MAFIPGWLISIVTFPGVIVHEWAHAVFCRVFNVPIHEVVYFQFGNPAGYVAHGEPGSYRATFMITVGPFLINTIAAMSVFLGTWLVADGSIHTILLWLGASIGMHAFPSNTDAEHLWTESLNQWRHNVTALVGFPVVAIIYLANLLSFLWFDLIYAGILYGIVTYPVLAAFLITHPGVARTILAPYTEMAPVAVIVIAALFIRQKFFHAVSGTRDTSQQDGGNGHHWAALPRTDIAEQVRATVQQPDHVEHSSGMTASYRGTGIETCAITADDTLVAAYPVLGQGVTHDLVLTGVTEDGVEARLTGRLGAETVTFFDTTYLDDRNLYQEGGAYAFSLAGIAHQLHVDPQGEDLAGFIAADNSAPDEVTFHTTVTNIAEVQYAGTRLLQIRAPLFINQNGRDVDILIYASPAVIQGEEPRVGDTVTGNMWLQGYLQEIIKQPATEGGR